MITITKQNDGVLFTFQDSDKYLYGNGTIEVPFNTLSIIADESDMITLKKAASNDVFLSARYDTDLGYRSKDDAIDDLKGMLFAETGGGGTGSGVTPSEVQEMIDESISGKADTSDVTAVANDVSTLSGQVATKVATSDFNAYSAATDSRLAEDEEVTAAALNDLDERIGDPYQKVSGLTIQYNSDGQTPEVIMELEDEELGSVTNIFNKWGVDVYTSDEETGHQNDAYMNSYGSMGVYDHSEGQEGDEDEGMMYDKSIDLYPDRLELNSQTDGADYQKSETVTITKDGITMNKYTNDNGDETSSSIEIKNDDGTNIHFIDGSDELDINNAGYEWTDGTDSRAVSWGSIATLYDIPTITSAVTSGSTDDEIPTAKATYDAIQAGGGGGATYSAGTNISIDTANTINCTLPMRVINNTNIDGGDKNSSMSRASSSISYGKGNNFARTLSYGAAFGQYNSLQNNAECSVGYASNSNYYSSTFGSSGNTLFTVGNGGSGEQVRHNAFEVRQNGDIYFPDTDNTTYQNFNQKPMVRLQDMYGALGGLKLVKLSQSEYDNLATKDNDTLYIISNVVS